MSDERGVRQFTELEGEYVERRLAGCIARLTDKATERRVRDRAKLARRTGYWARAMECHRAGLDHDGIERIRRDYAAHLKAAVRHGLPVSEAVAASEAYRKAAENRRRYEKGRHTSFANRSMAVDDSMRAERGYKAKRQDGKTIGPEHLAEIDAIITDFESVVGPMADLFAKSDITIAHTCGKHPFMRPSGGVYHSSERTISVGVVVGGAPIRAGVHELAHWLDAEAGRAAQAVTQSPHSASRDDSRPTHLSETVWNDYGDAERNLLRGAKRAINRTRDIHHAFSSRTERSDERDLVRASLGPYWTHPCEVFARLTEQWFALEIGHECAAADSPEAYARKPGYWTEADFDGLMPDVCRAVERRIGILRRQKR